MPHGTRPRARQGFFFPRSRRGAATVYHRPTHLSQFSNSHMRKAVPTIALVRAVRHVSARLCELKKVLSACIWRPGQRPLSGAPLSPCKTRREIEKFIIRQPPIGEKDDYDSENSWISDGLPSSSRRRRRDNGRWEGETGERSEVRARSCVIQIDYIGIVVVTRTFIFLFESVY